MLNWLEVVAWRADRHPDALFISDDTGAELSYSQFFDLVEERAGGWSEFGVEDGRVVALMERNSASFLVNVFAIARAGGLPALINWRLAVDEVAQLLALVEPVAVAAGPEHHETLDRLSPERPRVFLGSAEAPAGWLPEAELAGAAPALAVSSVAPERPFVLLFSSGTTGVPKGIPMTHRGLLRTSAADTLTVPEMVEGARHLMFLPLFHLAGFGTALYAPYTGGSIHIQRGFVPEDVITTVQLRRIQFTSAAPAMFHALVNAARERSDPPDMSSLIEVFYGASPIPEELARDTIRLIPCRLRQNYGLTEAAGPVTSLEARDHRLDSNRLRTAGRVTLGWEVRILDQDGVACASGVPGEVTIRSRSLFPGYWEAPGQLSEPFDPDGWFRTGDIGSMDGDGYLTLLDRAKDMVVSGGENVYPIDVETVIFEHPDVIDVAVIGVPSDRWGESVHAVVVRSNPDLTEAEIIEWSRERLTHFKCPRSVTFAESLPRNAGGKLLKREIRRPFWNQEVATS